MTKLLDRKVDDHLGFLEPLQEVPATMQYLDRKRIYVPTWSGVESLESSHIDKIAVKDTVNET